MSIAATPDLLIRRKKREKGAEREKEKEREGGREGGREGERAEVQRNFAYRGVGGHHDDIPGLAVLILCTLAHDRQQTHARENNLLG